MVQYSVYIYSFVSGFFNSVNVRFIKNFPVSGVHSFLLLNSILLFKYISLFTHPSVDGHLGSFLFRGIMNKDAINIFVQDYLWTYLLCFSWVSNSE